MAIEKTDRNIEFYIRCWVDGESIYDLLKEYGFGFSRAYQIKALVERKYPDELEQIRG